MNSSLPKQISNAQQFIKKTYPLLFNPTIIKKTLKYSFSNQTKVSKDTYLTIRNSKTSQIFRLLRLASLRIYWPLLSTIRT